MPMNAASVGASIGTDDATRVGRHGQSGAVHLPGAGLAAQLGGELDDLGDAGGPERMAPGHQPATGVDGHALAPRWRCRRPAWPGRRRRA